MNSKVYFENCYKQEVISIVCAADNNYAMPLAVMARSILENLTSDRNILLFVIDGGIQEYNRKKILKSLDSSRCKVVFLKKPDDLMKEIEASHEYCVTRGIEAKSHLSMPAYYRLLIAELLPEKLEKVIYLDCDLIVEGNLEHLWEMDIDDNLVLAVPDMWISSVSAHNGLLNYQELGINANDKYFNSGVMIVNLKQWRREKIFSLSVKYFNKNKNYVRFHDQDILNAILAERWKEIDARWNFTPTIHEFSTFKDDSFSESIYKNVIHDACIIHYASGEKPWNSHNVYLKEIFFKYVDMTAWAGWRFTFWRELKIKLEYKLKKAKSMLGL